MGKVVVKAGIDFKAGDLGLDHLDQLPGVIHAGDGVLDAHDVGMHLSQLQHGLSRDGRAGVGGEVIDVDGAIDLAGQAVIVLQQCLGAEPEIVGRQDHDCVRALLQAVVGKVHDLIRHHAAGADDQLHPVIHPLNGKPGHFPALIHGHGEELAGAALHQNSVNAFFDQIVEESPLALQIQAAVLAEQGNSRSQIRCFHFVMLPFLFSVLRNHFPKYYFAKWHRFLMPV